MDAKTCSTCHYWRPRPADGRGTCEGGDYRTPTAESMEVALTGSGDDWNVFPVLVTGPLFGCTLHHENGVEPRQTP